MKIRFAKDSDKKQIYQTMGYCFNNSQHSIQNNIEHGNLNSERFVLATDDNDNIISLFSIIPYVVNFEGHAVNFGGIAGVSSLPERRGEGNIGNLFTFALNYMKENNVILSGLGPFAFPFYRKFGYEWCYSWQLVSFDIEDLKNCISAKKYHRFNKDEANIVEEFRNKVTKNMNGPLIRDDNVINNKWQEYYDNNYYVYGAYDENDVLVSYMVYRMEGKEIKVSEMYFLNETSRQYLLNFLYRHRSQINKVELVLTTLDEFRNLLPSPRINYWQWPNKMGRVVMVKEALELLNIKDNFKGSYTLKINDKYAPWNDKIFQISCQNHHLLVNEKITKKFDYEITIQRLSQLILGHLSASEALSLELIKVNNSNKNDLLTKTFTKRTTMLWQEF